MVDAANHIFLPWVQPGMAGNIPEQARERLATDQAAVISLPVKLVVNSDTVDKTVRFYGPGDVTGIDPQQVVRTEPRHLTTDFEPNYFPAIEFDRPDFPWLFTPLKADTQGRLRPWLCLVIVRKQEGVELRPAGIQPLPVLEIKAPAQPANELPDLSESHLWAHAQVTGALTSQVASTLESDPAQTVSRLICPRRLAPQTEYIACVVPAFEVGCKAGLNLPPVAGDNLTPAWNSGATPSSEVRLPVYYSWEFRTGAGGDFEELVRRLQPRELPPEAGKRPMDINQPGFLMQPQPLPDTPGTTLGLEGALRVVGSTPDAWMDGARGPFQSALEKILNTPWEIATKDGTGKDPIVAPPIYGCWLAAAHQVSATAPAPPPAWLNELNLDPRNRAVAAMGTQVVQDQQEQLMASAWEQLGDIEKINQRLKQAQLSRAVNDRYHSKTFKRLSDEAFMRVVAPAQSRVMLEDRNPNQPTTLPVKMLLAQKVAGSFAPATTVSGSLRKITRPRGAINREYLQSGAGGFQATFGFFNSTTGPMTADPGNVDKGAVTINQISTILANQIQSNRGFIFVDEPPIPGHWERVSVVLNNMLATFRLSSLSGTFIASKQPAPPLPDFYIAAKAHEDYLTLLFLTLIFAEFRRVITTSEVKLEAMASLNPAKTVSVATYSSLQLGSLPLSTGDELDPVMDAPTFPQPMYEALCDISQDLLFPGLEHVPPNTVQLLQTNAKFIESFMVGLNTEMGRELLWRNYPTDQRGTYFQQFWDTAAAGAEADVDIPPIHKWGNQPLGGTAVGPGGDKLVLLIRGELLRRYPGTVIYAVKAVVKSGQRMLSTNPDDEAHPIFRGSLEPDVTFIGFNLTAADVVAGDGWFFVLQQQPTEPRFGLDDDPFSEGESGIIPPLTNWNNLNWAHLAPSAAELKQLSHVPVGGFKLVPTEPVKGTWGHNAAHMAYITKQAPVRIAIHATRLIL